jgi:hypothetical protein
MTEKALSIALSEKFDDMTDAETTDRSRHQSLQVFDCFISSQSEPTLEVPLFKTNSCKNKAVHLDSSLNHLAETSKLALSNSLYSPSDLAFDRQYSFISDDSDLPSEELIINENIDFLIDSSNSTPISTSPAFSYTLSDSSSVFDSISWSHNLIATMPPSMNHSLSLVDKKNETFDLGFEVEREDITEAARKLRDLKKNEGSPAAKTNEATLEHSQDSAKGSNMFNSDIEAEELEIEITFEKDPSFCTCASCTII